MRDPKRITGILTLIEQIWKRNPDLRLGQLLTNTIKHDATKDIWGGDLYNMEDDDLVKALRVVYSKDV
jgi:uncharacterized protein YihD (DUF1040 family)